jgi:dihydrodipicolinate synthase/N-acetylneuraminate lyase
MTVGWNGVYPAVTTQFGQDESLDIEATQRSIEGLIKAGMGGLIMLGTVGENCSLSANEKLTVLRAAKEAAGGRVPVLSGVAEYTTALGETFARDCEKIGIDGLMVLPAMVYKSDGRETAVHFRRIAHASDLPIMVYNNPVSYGVDITPEEFVGLADEKTIVAIKESSENVRRITDIVNLLGERFVLFAGVDDLVLESMLLGTVGWVSGLVNVFPEESVRLLNLACAGAWDEARTLYRWLTPSFHLDTSTKLVQNIKLGQHVMGLGAEWVRAPRLLLEGAERAAVIALIETAAENRPALKGAA